MGKYSSKKSLFCPILLPVLHPPSHLVCRESWPVWTTLAVLAVDPVDPSLAWAMTLSGESPHSSLYVSNNSQSGALSLVQILEILCSHWLNLTMLAPRSMPCMISGFHARKGSIIGALMAWHKEPAKGKKYPGGIELVLYGIRELAL